MNNKNNKPICIAYDFDGVMTDNKVIVNENGIESVAVNRSDGLAVSLLREAGIDQVIISTEQNPIVSVRARKLNLPVMQDVEDKGEAIRKYCNERHYDLSDVMFIGNDINDLPALKLVGYRGCPADAHEKVSNVCDWISTCKGGEGVVRELYDWIIRL